MMELNIVTPKGRYCNIKSYDCPCLGKNGGITKHCGYFNEKLDISVKIWRVKRCKKCLEAEKKLKGERKD